MRTSMVLRGPETVNDRGAATLEGAAFGTVGAEMKVVDVSAW